MTVPWVVSLLLFGNALSLLSLSGQAQPMAVDAQEPTQSQDPPQTSSSSRPSDWRFELSPYIGFAGAHGSVGALGRTASFRARPTDLLSHFNFGIVGAAEAGYNRFLLTADLQWVRLSDDRALVFPTLSPTALDVRVGQFVWTSKIGYRVIDHEKSKADENIGARYWHPGQKLDLNTSILGLSITPSQSWGDLVVGGRTPSRSNLRTYFMCKFSSSLLGSFPTVYFLHDRLNPRLLSDACRGGQLRRIRSVTTTLYPVTTVFVWRRVILPPT